MLAIGVYLGAPWLVNPILSGLSVLLVYLLVWNMYDRVTARLSLMLLATSPWFLFLGMSYMTHIFSLVAPLGAAVAACKLRQGASLWWGAAGGLGGDRADLDGTNLISAGGIVNTGAIRTGQDGGGVGGTQIGNGLGGVEFPLLLPTETTVFLNTTGDVGYSIGP